MGLTFRKSTTQIYARNMLRRQCLAISAICFAFTILSVVWWKGTNVDKTVGFQIKYNFALNEEMPSRSDTKTNQASTSRAVLNTNVTTMVGIHFETNFTLNESMSSLSNTKTNQVSTTPSERKPLILSWGHPWFQKEWGYPEGGKIGRCTVTYDRSRLNDSDAVLFHYTVIGKDDMPWKYYRNRDQVYIWWSREAPAILDYQKRDLREFDGGFFNWSFTYRQDADVMDLYGYRGNVLNSVTKGIKVVDEIIAGKKKLAIWIVSQCDRTKGARLRMKYANELKEAGINFTAYGKCFSGSDELLKSNPQPQLNVIREHKFYFAFENALHCTDYVTEKFWRNALTSDAVPIVWGPTKKDILSIAPLDSFVFAEDFESAAKLAEYLEYLDANDDEYRKYFRWRENESMTDEKMIKLTQEKYVNISIQERPANLCDKLLQRKNDKIIHSLVDEFLNKNPKECVGKS